MRSLRGLCILLLGVFIVSLSGGEVAAGVVAVRVETIPDRTYLVRTTSGSYRQHQTVMNEVIAQAIAMGIPRSSVVCCTGIYPMDPDVTANESDLEWYIAVEVPAGTTLAGSSSEAKLPGMLEGNVKAAPGTLESRALTLPPKEPNPYMVVTMPSTLAVTTTTTYSRIGTDALIIKEYIYDNGYVQTASTRTVMLAGDPNDPITQTIQLAFPVTTRGSVSIARDGVKVKEAAKVGGSEAEPGLAGTAGAIKSMPAGSSLVDSPEKTVLYRTLRGSYAQQQQACSQLLATAAGLGAGGKPCIRLELIEPDAVTDEALLEWRVATEVPAGKVPPAPYEMGTLPASKAVVKTTSLAQVPADQLTMSSWLVVAGYVHAAPVRTTFLPNGSVRLEVPVQPRFRQLPAELFKAQEVSAD